MVRVVGRVCLCILFLWSAVHHARSGAASEALVASGLPGGAWVVTAAAVVCGAATLLLLLDALPQVGAAILALLLLPATYFMDVVPLAAVRRSCGLPPLCPPASLRPRGRLLLPQREIDATAPLSDSQAAAWLCACLIPRRSLAATRAMWTWRVGSTYSGECVLFHYNKKKATIRT